MESLFSLITTTCLRRLFGKGSLRGAIDSVRCADKKSPPPDAEGSASLLSGSGIEPPAHPRAYHALRMGTLIVRPTPPPARWGAPLTRPVAVELRYVTETRSALSLISIIASAELTRIMLESDARISHNAHHMRDRLNTELGFVRALTWAIKQQRVQITEPHTDELAASIAWQQTLVDPAPYRAFITV